MMHRTLADQKDGAGLGSASVNEASEPKLISLILPDLLPFGGVERVVVAKAEELLRRGYNVDLVFVNEPANVSASVPPGCRVINLGVSRLRFAFIPLLRYLRTMRPDAVQVCLWPLTCIVVLAHRFARLPGRVLVSDHNPLSIQYCRRGLLHHLLLRLSLAIVYPLASARVAVSNAVAEDLAWLSGLHKKQFHVIHNPVCTSTTNLSDKVAAEAAWGQWSGIRVLTVGRLKAQKNHALLLRAFRSLRLSVDARLMILGTGELEAEMKDLVRAQCLGDHVLMPGHVHDTSAYYNSADLFVLSSDYEGFGNVLVEALSHGLPIVSTDCPGGPREILADGRFGRLIPVGDEVALAKAMALALCERSDPKLLKSRAADFAPSLVVAHYLELLFDARSSGVRSLLNHQNR